MTPRPAPPEAYAAALAALPGIGPARLLELVRRGPLAKEWAAVCAGGSGCEGGDGSDDPGDEPAAAFAVPRPAGNRSGAAQARAARRVDVAGRWRELRGAGIGVTYLGAADYPPRLRDDPSPPAVLFWRGDLGVLERDAVAVVGTRRATGYGRGVAHRIAHDLSGEGLCVVSGLALGIDGAAHEGALAARPGWTAGVAASGVDVPYPRRHAGLWDRVIDRGVVVSETGPGHPAQPWRFPARNRIIAGLVRAVVVVESHARGGSLHTVDAAAERGIDVLVVPGPVTSPASEGTNQLLRDGRAPVRHARDVLDELGRFPAWSGGSPPPAASGGAHRLDETTRAVLDAVDWTPTATAVVAERTGLGMGPLGVVLVRLESWGVLRGRDGWWERAGDAPRRARGEDERMV